MATFSGGLGLEIRQLKLNKLDDDIIDSAIGKEVRTVMNIGKKTMKEMRENIVNDWFGRFDGSTMNQCTKYEATFKQPPGKVVITITSYIDSGMYQNEHYRSADLWHSKYGGDMFPGDYILSLQLYNGIIGLPEKSTWRDDMIDHPWINHNFHQQDPLQNVLNRELPKKWNKKINENYEKERR